MYDGTPWLLESHGVDVGVELDPPVTGLAGALADVNVLRIVLDVLVVALHTDERVGAHPGLASIRNGAVLVQPEDLAASIGGVGRRQFTVEMRRVLSRGP